MSYWYKNMNQLTYNISLAVGTVLVTAGAAVLWGVGFALLACGFTILSATALTLIVTN